MDKELDELEASRAKQKFKAIFRKKKIMGLEKRLEEKQQEVRSLEHELGGKQQEISCLIDELQDARSERDSFHALFGRGV